MISAKPIQKYQSSDGTEFSSRDAALEHSKFLARKKNLQATLTGMNPGAPGVGLDDASNVVIFAEDVAEFIAARADVILAALDVKERRGPRKKGEPVVQAATPAV